MRENGVIRGCLDTIANSCARGWAFETGTNNPVKVFVYAGEELIAEGLADEYRPDIVKKGMHSTGNCKFTINLPQESYDQEQPIRVLAGTQKTELRNSPMSLKAKVESPVVLDPTHTKVLVIGRAKSGTSILTYKIADALPDKEIFFEPEGRNGLINLELHKKIAKSPNVVTKCIFFSKTPNKLKEISRFYNKKIWIVRDPRDTLISSFLYLWNKGHNPNKAKFEKAFDLVLKKEKSPTKVSFSEILHGVISLPNFADEYNAIINQVKGLDEENWLVFKYEDLVDSQFDKLNDYLGFKVSEETDLPNRFNRVVRSKKYGNWRNWYTRDDLQQFKKLFNDQLDYLGYDSKDWKLNKKKVLPPEQGSEYMEKLFTGSFKRKK